jgi:hypothetical protein
MNKKEREMEPCGFNLFEVREKNCCNIASGRCCSKEPEWKTLDIDNIPGNIFFGDYEFQKMDVIDKKYVELKANRLVILEACFYGSDIQYRLKPTQKTDEELAEEYVNIYAPKLPVDIYGIGEIADRECLRAHKRRAFIAGRQSKDGE